MDIDIWLGLSTLVCLSSLFVLLFSLSIKVNCFYIICDYFINVDCVECSFLQQTRVVFISSFTTK